MAEPPKTDRWPECAAQLDPRLAGFFLDVSTPHTATYRKLDEPKYIHRYRNIRYDLSFEVEAPERRAAAETIERSKRLFGTKPRLSFWRRFLNMLTRRT